MNPAYRRLDLRSLQAVAAVFECSSIHGAARQLNISQPAVSKTIRDLEAALDVKLFDRNARGVIPTVFGDTLYKYARRMDNEVHNAVSEINMIRGVDQGVVRLGCGPGYGNQILPLAMAALRARQRRINLKIYGGMLDEMLPKLLQGDLDMVFSVMPHVRDEPDLEYVPVSSAPSICVGRREHPLADRRKISAEELVQHEWILPDQPSDVRRRIEDAFSDAGVLPPVPVYEANSIFFIKALLDHTDTLTYLPRSMVWLELEIGRLKEIDVDIPYKHQIAGYIVRKGATLPPAGEELLEEMLKVIRAQPDHHFF